MKIKHIIVAVMTSISLSSCSDSLEDHIDWVEMPTDRQEQEEYTFQTLLPRMQKGIQDDTRYKIVYKKDGETITLDCDYIEGYKDKGYVAIYIAGKGKVATPKIDSIISIEEL